MLRSFVHGERDPGTDFWKAGAGVVVGNHWGRSMDKGWYGPHRPHNVKDGTYPL